MWLQESYELDINAIQTAIAELEAVRNVFDKAGMLHIQNIFLKILISYPG